MRKIWSWALVMTVIIAGACDEDDNENSTKTLQKSDRDFVTNASEANAAEIELGKLATQYSNTPSVQAFGQMMVTEHQNALNELESIADSKDATVVKEPNAEHQKMKERLMGYSGYAFDTAYIHSQIKDHQKAMMLFQTQSSNGQDAELRAYASKYLPHIQMHYDKADSINNTLNQ